MLAFTVDVRCVDAYRPIGLTQGCNLGTESLETVLKPIMIGLGLISALDVKVSF